MRAFIVLTIVAFCGLGAPNATGSTTPTIPTTTIKQTTTVTKPGVTQSTVKTQPTTAAPIVCVDGTCKGDGCKQALTTANCTIGTGNQCTRTSTGNATHPAYNFGCTSTCTKSATLLCCSTTMCNTPPKPNNGVGTVTPTIFCLFSLLALVF